MHYVCIYIYIYIYIYISGSGAGLRTRVGVLESLALTSGAWLGRAPSFNATVLKKTFRRFIDLLWSDPFRVFFGRRPEDRASLFSRRGGETAWSTLPMAARGNRLNNTPVLRGQLPVYAPSFASLARASMIRRWGVVWKGR